VHLVVGSPALPLTVLLTDLRLLAAPVVLQPLLLLSLGLALARPCNRRPRLSLWLLRLLS
jgi:hypothetical protein